VDVRICEQRLSTNKSLAGMKHLNRLEQILARAEWQDEYAEGLLMDESGNLIEATVSNLFAVKNNQLYTPDLSLCGVAGIMRRTVMEVLAPTLSLKVEVAAMSLDCVRCADELFLCNSVYAIWPVKRLVDQRNAPTMVTDFVQHSITRQLQNSFEQLFLRVD
jgi:4-amino-4-deoxychorismate lyase